MGHFLNVLVGESSRQKPGLSLTVHSDPACCHRVMYDLSLFVTHAWNVDVDMFRVLMSARVKE